MDHHCIFLNNCVGNGNHRWFLLFLLSHVWFCVYASGMLWWNLQVIARREQLWASRYLDHNTGRVVPASFWMVSRWLANNHTFLWAMCVLASVMIFVLSGFFVYHLVLACTNQTTNERHKRAVLRRELQRFLHEHAEEAGGDEDQDHQADQERQQQQQGARRRGGRRRGGGGGPSGEPPSSGPKSLTVKDLAAYPDLLDNSYDRGVPQNLKETFFPPRLE